MRWTFLAAVASLVLAAAAPAHAGETQAFGSHGDKPYHDECEPGRYMTGVSWRSGAWMDQVTVICSRLESDGTLVDPRPLTPRGGEGGAGPFTASCPPSSVIREINVANTSDNSQVSALKFTCRSTGGPLFNSFKVGNSEWFGNLENTASPRRCPNGEVATGLHGGYGRHVNSAGLICGPQVIPKPLFRPVTRLGVHRTPPPVATATALDDVDVYDGPDGGRYNIIGMMPQGKSGAIITVVEGWCLLGGVGPAGGQGWVASDHLAGCGK